MPATGGRMPFDATGALAGPARVVYADPAVEPVPADLWDVITPIADANGEYPTQGNWGDFGLAADAPSYTHSKDTAGLEYQQSRGELFTQISTITRSFTAQVGEITPDNMQIVENTSTVQAIAAGAGRAGQTKVPFGVYQSFKTYRICLISYRPDGSALVTEPGGLVTRPPAVALVFPLMVLAAEDSEFSFELGTPVNAAISFNALRTPDVPAGQEHGFWIFESPGTVAGP